MECNECNMCCILPELPIINKKPNIKCKHLIECSEGCQIYDTKPKGCSQFECYWFKHKNLPEELRPDKCNIIFEYLTDDIILALTHPEGIKENTTQTVIKLVDELVFKNHSIIVSSYTDAPTRFLLPKGVNKESVLEKINLIEIKK